jgi:WD40 repeat protein
MCAVAIAPNAQTVATGHANGTITLWNPANGKKKRTLTGHTAKVHSLKYTPGGETLVSSGEDGTVRVWNPERERALDVFTLGPSNGRMVMDIDPSGKYLLATGEDTLIYILRLPGK